METSKTTYKNSFSMTFQDYVELEQSILDMLKLRNITPEKVIDCIETYKETPEIKAPYDRMAWVIFRNIENYGSQLDKLYSYLNDDTITAPLKNIIKHYIAE